MHSQISNSQKLEQILSQRVQALFEERLGHQPEDVYCRFLDNKLTVIIRNAVTKPEQLLMAAGYEEVVRKARNSIEEILRPYFKGNYRGSC